MSKKIAFMGTPTISGQILKSLYQNGFNIEVVYTQPPVASNRIGVLTGIFNISAII